jgi:hypothetical protein
MGRRTLSCGGDHFLQRYWATPGHDWNHKDLGEEPFADQPAIAVESNGMAHAVVRGPNNSLHYYRATPGSRWSEYTIPAGNGMTFLVARDCGVVERGGGRCCTGTQQFPAVVLGRYEFGV